MGQTEPQFITATICPRRGGVCAPGCTLARRLTAALTVAQAAVGSAFQLGGEAEALCPEGPCRLGWLADAGGAQVFGGVASGCDVAALAARPRDAEGAPIGFHGATIRAVPGAGLRQ